MGGVDREVADVVGRRDLDDVDGHDVVLDAELADHAQQVDGRQTARFGGAGAGRVRRVEAVDVERDVEQVGAGEGLGDGVGHHLLEPALPDLLHRVPAHLLLLHPRERVGGRPVAAQPDLHEPVAGNGSRFDEASHRRAVAGQVAVDDVGGVGVGVEVDDADVAVAVDVGDGGGRRPRDRVVATEDHRHDAARCDLVDAGADVGVARLGLAVRAVGVAVVDHLDPLEDLDAEIEVIGARLVRQRTDRPRAEPGAGAVGGRDVERRADDGDVGLPFVELLGIGQERPLGERGEPAEHPADRELLLHAGAELASRFSVIVACPHRGRRVPRKR